MRERLRQCVADLRLHFSPEATLRIFANVWLESQTGRERRLTGDELTELVVAPLPFSGPCPQPKRPALNLHIPTPTEPAQLSAWLGDVYQVLLSERDERRARGAHHTDPALAREVVERTLVPLFAATQSRTMIVCDPAVGSGVFLVEAAHTLRRLMRRPVHEIVAHSLRGVDIDPGAVFCARLGLFALSDRTRKSISAIERSVVVGDFVTADPFAGEIDAYVGNPPWIAYKGRAAEPLPRARAEYLKQSCEAFAGYPTLHGVFVERCAARLTASGRLGLIVPTSMADLAGYAPTRRAHDRHCQVDPSLTDYGAHAFAGVFQPAMALHSTKRACKVEPGSDEWALTREDVDLVTMALLDRTKRMPRVPGASFGERGIQTTAADKPRMAKERSGRFSQPLLSGTEVRPFQLLPPQLFVAPKDFATRLRSEDDWREVDVLIRQTARFPMAAMSSGAPFRNSVLAGFSREPFSSAGLIAFLNSNVVRFLHYQRFRDARQGMPQLKIGHLRSLPLPSTSQSFFGALDRIGLQLLHSAHDTEAMRQLDALVAAAFELTEAEQQRVRLWAQDLGRVPTARALTNKNQIAKSDP
jgi:hypothetical protein